MSGRGSNDTGMEWFPFRLGPYAKKTGHLTCLEHGAYGMLMRHYYTVGSLPKADRSLAAICRLSLPQWKAIRPTIAEFFDADWKQDRIERELAEFRAKSEVRAEAGRKGGRPKASGKPPDGPPPGAAELPLDTKSPPKSEGDFLNPRGGADFDKSLETLEPTKAKAFNLVSFSFPELRKEIVEVESSSLEASAREPEPAPPAEPAKRDDDEILFQKVKSALGPKAPEPVVRLGIGSIRHWLAQGFDLERDVLPELRDIGSHLNQPLRTMNSPRWGEQVAARHKARVAREKANAAVPKLVFVEQGSPQWDAWKAYRGKGSPTCEKAGKAGWWFAAAWPPGFDPETVPPPSRRVDLSGLLNRMVVQ
jgi:hypothetical protein